MNYEERINKLNSLEKIYKWRKSRRYLLMLDKKVWRR